MSRVPDICDLISTHASNAVMKTQGVGDKPMQLDPDDLERLKKLSRAGSNTHSAAVMGLRVVASYLFEVNEQPEGDLCLNEASALINLLGDLAHIGHDQAGSAEIALREHWKIVASKKGARS